MIFVVLNLILAVALFYLVMRYNLHMFQLNSYKKAEHLKWLGKNIRKQAGPVLLFIISLVSFYGLKAGGVGLLIVMALEYLSIIYVIIIFSWYKKSHTKKKLVFTPRVKRLMTMDVIVSFLLFFISLIMPVSGLFRSQLALCISSLQPLLLMVAALINTPIEQGVNNHYINDAKRILSSNEGIVTIGITGSYGKTSMKFYLQTLLSVKYNVLATPESYNTPMGVVKTIRGSLRATHEIFLCEMGARHVGDIKEICDIVHPKHGIITSVGPQHLETFFTIDNIKKTKFELADALPTDGLLFINEDSEYVREQAIGYQNPICYGYEYETSGYKAKLISVSNLGSELLITTPKGESEIFKTKLLGSHNMINICGAVAVANTLGISLKDLRLPVRRLEPVAHRMQIVEHPTFTIIDDAFNSNPVGSKAAVETLALFNGVKILITPGMVELGAKEEELNEAFGGYAADCCDYILLVGKKRTEPIAKGALERGFSKERLKSFDKFEEALEFARKINQDGHKYILLENDLPDNY